MNHFCTTKEKHPLTAVWRYGGEVRIQTVVQLINIVRADSLVHLIRHYAKFSMFQTSILNLVTDRQKTYISKCLDNTSE